jgi:DNA polymerase-1
VGCSNCPLNTRPRISGGEGTAELATIIIIGEAPGATEISLDRPFVGQSGKLLRATLNQFGLPDHNFYLTNTCLCRPEGNATPTGEAMKCCSQRLSDEIFSAPNRRVIIPVGNVATAAILGLSKVSITTMHGVPTWSEDYDCYVVPTFHPAAILRMPTLYRDFGDDLSFAINDVPRDKVPAVEPPLAVPLSMLPIWGLADALEMLRWQKYLVCDIETTGFNPRRDRILSVMVYGGTQNAYVFPAEMFQQRAVKDFFEDPNILWVGHNASQFDAEFLLEHFHINWYPKFDTLLAHYCVDERQGGHGLKALARRLFFAGDYSSEMKAHMKDNTLDQVPLETLREYQALDCLYTYKLVPFLKRQMDIEEVSQVHDGILIPLSHAFRDIELRGIKVDVPYLEKLQVVLQGDIDERKNALEKTAKDEGLTSFNPNSPKQVAELLYDKMRLASSAKRSTDRTTLAGLHSGVADRILEFRMASKLLNTYATGLVKHVDTDGRIHADFLLFGTQTGRLSCQNPNLHNIPSLMRGPEIKKAFVPSSSEWCIMEADFSQLELRVAAFLSQDQKLIQTYRDGQDFHKRVASEMFSVPMDQVTKQQRHIAKYVDFGILYGRGAKSLAEGWSAGQDLAADALTKDVWTVKMAQGFIDRMMQQFPQLHKWMMHQQTQVIEDHFVVTPFGRRRRFPFIMRDNAAEIQRQAVNFPIQSVASDICQLSLIELHNSLNPGEAFIVSTVHDSILMEVRRDIVFTVAHMVHGIMETPPPRLDFNVPLKVDISIGSNWGELEGV